MRLLVRIGIFISYYLGFIWIITNEKVGQWIIKSLVLPNQDRASLGVIIGFILFVFITFIALICHHSYESSIRLTFISPNLGKKIVHESGVYNIIYLTYLKKYIICQDFLFFDIVIVKLDADSIENSANLLKRVKSNLDNIYRDKVEEINYKKNRINALKEWDGYTSDQLKRDDRINQVIK